MPVLSHTKQAAPQHVSNQEWPVSTPTGCLGTPGNIARTKSVLLEHPLNDRDSVRGLGVSRPSILDERNQYSLERSNSSTSNADYSTVESAGTSGNTAVAAIDPDLVWVYFAAGILVLFSIGWCLLKAEEISRRNRSEVDPNRTENGEQTSNTVGEGSPAASFLSREQSQEPLPKYQREDPTKAQTQPEIYEMGRL